MVARLPTAEEVMGGLLTYPSFALMLALPEGWLRLWIMMVYRMPLLPKLLGYFPLLLSVLTNAVLYLQIVHRPTGRLRPPRHRALLTLMALLQPHREVSDREVILIDPLRISPLRWGQ